MGDDAGSGKPGDAPGDHGGRGEGGRDLLDTHGGEGSAPEGVHRAERPVCEEPGYLAAKIWPGGDKKIPFTDTVKWLYKGV